MTPNFASIPTPVLNHSLFHELGNARSSISQSPTASGGNFWLHGQYYYANIRSSSRPAQLGLGRGAHKLLAFECSYVQSQSPGQFRGTFPSWLRCISVLVISTDTDVKAYTVFVYSSSQSTVGSIDEGARTSYPENRIAGVREDNFLTTCNSHPESMCQTLSPRFITVCELTIYPSLLI